MYAVYTTQSDVSMLRGIFPISEIAEAYARQLGVECFITCPPDTATLRSLLDETAPLACCGSSLNRRTTIMDEDIVIVAIVKQATGERYLFHFRPTVQECQRVLRQAGRWAADPDLSFSWKDAGTVAFQARRFLAEANYD